MGYTHFDKVSGINGLAVGPEGSEFALFDGSGNVNRAYSSASVSGVASVEPFIMATTMTGAGGVGGRARFQLNANAALGGWANALKAITIFGASGRVTGLGSAFCAELQMSAGTTQGTYAPLESELNLPENAVLPSTTSFFYANVDGHSTPKAAFNANGYLFQLGAGIVAGDTSLFRAKYGSASHSLRIRVGASDYFLLLAQTATT